MTSTDDVEAPAYRWTLGYEAEGSDDAAWTIRCGNGTDTDVYEVTDEIDPDDPDSAQRWAEEYLGRVLEGRVVARWKSHRPGPGTSPDYYVAIFEDSVISEG